MMTQCEDFFDELSLVAFPTPSPFALELMDYEAISPEKGIIPSRTSTRLQSHASIQCNMLESIGTQPTASTPPPQVPPDGMNILASKYFTQLIDTQRMFREEMRLREELQHTVNRLKTELVNMSSALPQQSTSFQTRTVYVFREKLDHYHHTVIEHKTSPPFCDSGLLKIACGQSSESKGVEPPPTRVIVPTDFIFTAFQHLWSLLDVVKPATAQQEQQHLQTAPTTAKFESEVVETPKRKKQQLQQDNTVSCVECQLMKAALSEQRRSHDRVLRGFEKQIKAAQDIFTSTMSEVQSKCDSLASDLAKASAVVGDLEEQLKLKTEEHGMLLRQHIAAMDVLDNMRMEVDKLRSQTLQQQSKVPVPTPRPPPTTCEAEIQTQQDVSDTPAVERSPSPTFTLPNSSFGRRSNGGCSQQPF
eukprot:PhF_6_TR37065/c0_g1_i3/m.54285